MAEDNLMEKIVSLCKRRGFIYQGSEIYGGLAGTWDYGPVGVELKRNIKNLWWKMFVQEREDVYGLDAAILMNPKVWEASGHTTGFSDPIVEDRKTKKKYRADHLLEDAGINTSGMSLQDISHAITKHDIKSPEGNQLNPPSQFNMMFKTSIGASEDTSSITYLRPETAGGIFVNFKNILDTFNPQIPFGIAQIGKAFRNEISPRDFVFRSREFEQMELEYFVKENNWEKHFEEWRVLTNKWLETTGFDMNRVVEKEIEGNDLAHYSKRTIDFEFKYPFGQKELYGLAYRTDYDLKNQAKESSQKLEYFDQESGERFTPHVIEPSYGIDRTVLAILVSAYNEEEVEGENRVFLKLDKKIAPIKVAILPLMRKDGLPEKAREIFKTLKSEFTCQYDETASIGKRYRRQDEIGTPYCVTVDYETLEDSSVTVRERDSMKQERIKLNKLPDYLDKQIYD